MRWPWSRAKAPAAGPPARFELLTRDGCHLCDEMAAVLDAVLPRLGLTWAPVDIDAHPDLAERFGEVIPVLLRDGKPVAKVRVTAKQLRRIVRGRRRLLALQ